VSHQFRLVTKLVSSQGHDCIGPTRIFNTHLSLIGQSLSNNKAVTSYCISYAFLPIFEQVRAYARLREENRLKPIEQANIN